MSTRLTQTSEKVFVSKTAGYLTDTADPSHEFESVQAQLYGDPGKVVDPAPMDGFVKAGIQSAKGDVAAGKRVMECFNPEALPTLSTLAQEFCVCTRWFAAIPGPTWPNRLFIHTATSDGAAANDALHLNSMRTIYDSLEEAGLTWRVYFNDIPQCLALDHLWGRLDHFKAFEDFHEDIGRGDLANYTFIEPRYFDFLEWKASDQHPPHDIRIGEYLIAEIYETLRASQLWESSLFVVLYDEHGGFFDKVSPPTGVPNPDGKVSQNPPFDFTRLGVRVPAVLVSPWIEKGSIDPTPYEHSSLAATLKALFGLPEFLTARDKAASTFEKNLSRSTPRDDTPVTLPMPGDPAEARRHRDLMRTGVLPELLGQAAGSGSKPAARLAEHHQMLLGLVGRLNLSFGKPAPAPAGPQSEHDAAVHILNSIKRLL